jgi:hypothetical protein
MARAASQAALNTVNNSWPMPQPRCPSSECSWPEISSLAVCSSIANVTEHLEWAQDGPDDAWMASLPNGFGYVVLNSIDREMMNISSPEAPMPEFSDLLPNMTREELSDLPPLVYPTRPTLGNWDSPDLTRATFSQLFVVFNNYDNNTDHKFRAVEILFHFCVNTYNVTFQDGTPYTALVASHVEIDAHASNTTQGGAYTMMDMHGEGAFKVEDTTDYSILETILRQDFTGPWSSSFSVDVTSPFQRQIGKNLYDEVNRRTPLVEAEQRMWNNLLKMTGNIADSMTA